MEFSHFLTEFSKIKNLINSKNYNGTNFQLKMTPKERLDFDMLSVTNPKESAVLVLLYPKNNKTYLLLTLRAIYKGTHSGQISLPGGKKNNEDINLIKTALRETEEEIGILQSQITNIVSLTKVYIPPSNFWIIPFIGITNTKPIFKPNYEVEKCIEINLDDLLNEKSITNTILSTSYAENMNVPCFILNDFIVWGATAMILSELREIIKLSLI